MGHENDVLLKAMQKVAARYDFEIGVNWCDGWLYYDWITKRYPEINTRKKKTEHYVRCYQYLIDSVFTGVTAPIVKGYPVFYLFGPGATVEEYKWAYERVRIPVGMNAPVVLRRWAIGADWKITVIFRLLIAKKLMNGSVWEQFLQHGCLPVFV